MLHELRIENLLLIERAELRLGPGLNAITGETGAGKTILAHSLNLLMGGRARAQIVRPGAGEAYVEGVFDLPPGLFEDPELAELSERLPEEATDLVLARRVAATGRTSAYVQGRSANVADLRLLGSRMLSFYGQHEHRRLTLGSAQVDVLDGYVGPEHLGLRARYEAAYDEAKALERQVAALRDREGSRERDLDLMRFELEEIEAADPGEEEREALGSERERLRNAESLRDAATAALAGIAGTDDEGGAAALLAASESALAALSGVDRNLDSIGERISAAGLELSDLASELRSYGDQVEAEPGRLEQVEERLAAIERLERKHGGTLASVFDHAEFCRAEIQRLQNAAELEGELEKRIGDARERSAKLAADLSAARRKAAPGLERAVANALAGLSMDGARLEVTLAARRDGGLTRSGAESVELAVATNPGMPASPLRDAASGGELSRIMLALCGLGGAAADGATRVFDEIDAGVGGTTARAVGERLRELAGSGQVLCITHLPQVASMADAHFRISKHRAGEATVASVESVVGDELVAEIVRMLGAESGDEAATTHARELLAA
ncbi:MAG: DNA repair protein RecN [Actinomycetota bacterium]|nr:DNA repair protein RecN [Actinomycetota bacterium]